MISSNDVFAKRKQGLLDDAYQLALQLMNAPGAGEWDHKALGWCLIDLIKRDSRAENSQHLEHYRLQLDDVVVSAHDDVFTKQRDYALSLCRPDGRLREEGKALSMRGEHARAAAVYREALAAQPADPGLQTSLGWELYRYSKLLLEHESVNVGLIKRNLNEYLKLSVDKPSILHSCFLQQAAKLGGQGSLNMLGFSRLWNLEFLRPEDFERFQGEDGKTYPALAEKVIRQACKDVIASQNATDLAFILPYLDGAIQRYPDNIWIKHSKAKVFVAVGRYEEAMLFGVDVAKAKPGEYWAWDLLGDICDASDQEATRSCYCKGLMCSRDDAFIGKLRLKLANILIAAGDFSRAKFEVERVVAFKVKAEQKIPEAAAQIVAQQWYADVEAASSNLDYYQANAVGAEALLFSNMPWISASVGERFTVSGQDGKPKKRRRLFIEAGTMPKEVNVRESEFPLSGASLGDPIRLKGEFHADNRFQLYLIEQRSAGAPWDIVPTKIGVVDHINEAKQVAHFIVERGVDGLIQLSEFSSTLHMGDVVAVKIARYQARDGARYRVLAAESTGEVPGSSVRKCFACSVRAEREMGFTPDDIFIPPNLMKAAAISDGDWVSGVAILNFNKKRNQWGWKAISASKQVGHSAGTDLQAESRLIW